MAPHSLGRTRIGQLTEKHSIWKPACRTAQHLSNKRVMLTAIVDSMISFRVGIIVCHISSALSGIGSGGSLGRVNIKHNDVGFMF